MPDHEIDGQVDREHGEPEEHLNLPGELGRMIQEMNTRLRTLTRNDHDVSLVYEDEVEDIVVQVTIPVSERCDSGDPVGGQQVKPRTLNRLGCSLASIGLMLILSMMLLLMIESRLGS